MNGEGRSATHCGGAVGYWEEEEEEMRISTIVILWHYILREMEYQEVLPASSITEE